MTRTVSIPLTALELGQLGDALAYIASNDRGFTRFGPMLDGAFTSALLKVARGRVALGVLKGIDLDLPPWATAAILDAMVPAAGVTLSPVAKVKAPRPRRAARPRRRRTDRRPRPAPSAGSVADVDRLADPDPLDDEAAS